MNFLKKPLHILLTGSSLFETNKHFSSRKYERKKVHFSSTK